MINFTPPVMVGPIGNPGKVGALNPFGNGRQPVPSTPPINGGTTPQLGIPYGYPPPTNPPTQPGGIPGIIHALNPFSGLTDFLNVVPKLLTQVFFTLLILVGVALLVDPDKTIKVVQTSGKALAKTAIEAG